MILYFYFEDVIKFYILYKHGLCVHIYTYEYTLWVKKSKKPKNVK